MDSGEDVGEEKSSCGASFGNVKISDLDFADDAVIFVETRHSLLEALELLNEESEPLDYRFPGSKLRSRLSMTSWMPLSCLHLFVVRMLRSRQKGCFNPPKHSIFTLAVICKIKVRDLHIHKRCTAA